MTSTLNINLGKTKQTRPDFLSHHPLPETEEDDIEHTMKAIINKEPAILIYKFKSETREDKSLLKLSPEETEKTTRETPIL